MYARPTYSLIACFGSGGNWEGNNEDASDTLYHGAFDAQSPRIMVKFPSPGTCDEEHVEKHACALARHMRSDINQPVQKLQ